MYENEPRLFFNYPLSGCVGVMASMVLVAQVFSLMFVTSLFFYLLEISFCFFFVFVLSMGVRQRKLGFISTYCLWLVIYIFWATCSMILVIWSESYCNSNAMKCYTDYCSYSTHNKEQCSNKDITVDSFRLRGAAIAGLVIMILAVTASLLLCALQLRFCFLLYRFIQQERRAQNERQVTYQHRPANSPPQYHEAPWPEKPPGYAEAISPAHASPIYTASAVVQPVEVAAPGQLEAGIVPTQQAAPELPMEMQLTQIDLDETPVMEETVATIVPSEVTVASTLSVTNPFKDEVERKV